MLSFLRRNFLTIDPRTLGLLRIVLASLLLVDLAKRTSYLRLFYTNSGLIPNHRVLWQPPREHIFSFLLGLSDTVEVQIAFGLIAIIYLCFLFGFRTRVMHALSWLSLVSLQMRADVLCSGADFVFSDLVLWSAFLPLGRRFSLDAVLSSLRNGNDTDLQGLHNIASTPRDTRPVVSLAVLALIMQLVVIYVFNTVQKNGANWRDGTAVYWLVHQERIVTAFGLWARDALPLWVFQSLSYATLVVEGAIPLLILSPWGRPWTRRIAIVSMLGLHFGMALMSNLGLFSPVMMTYALCLIEARDWDMWERRARSVLQLSVDLGCGLCFQAARVWTRLDTLRRIEIHALDPGAAADSCGFVQTRDGLRFEHAQALRRLLGVLPLGLLLSAAAQLLQPIIGPIARWSGRNRDAISRELALQPAHTCIPARHSAAAFTEKLHRIRFWAGQLLVLALIVVATSQVLNENRAVPRALKHDQPRIVRAAVGYSRLSQGWSMFAPEAPMHDRTIVIDAVTSDGRHVDPWNEVASRVSDPTLRTIPERLGHDAAHCDYSSSVSDDESLYEPLHDWIMSYHRRTHHPADRIRHFKAYVIEHDGPRPGEQAPSNVEARVFLRD